MRRLTLLLLSGLLAVPLGCATAPPKGPGPAAGPPARPRVAMIPIESRRFAKFAARLNEALGNLVDAKVWDIERPKVGLEDLQLSIECIEPSPSCYRAVGTSLKVDRIVFGRVARDGKRGMKASVTLFDVPGKRVITTVERRFPSTAPKALNEVTRGLEAMAKDAMKPLEPPPGTAPATGTAAPDRPSS